MGCTVVDKGEFWLIMSSIGHYGRKQIANSLICQILSTDYMAGTDSHHNEGANKPVPGFPRTHILEQKAGITHIITSIVTFRECIPSAWLRSTDFTYIR